VTTRGEYLGLFCDAPPGAIVGEASTDYLSCPGVAERLHAWNPDAKIIVMLRDPIDRAYSEYQHSIAASFQTLSFAESLREEKRRFAEGYDPIFAHVRRGLYADGVKDFQQKFWPVNVEVILFEQFSSSTQAIVQSVFEFLALSPMKVDVSERFGLVKSPVADLAQASRAINNLAIGKNRTGPRAELSCVEYESLRDEFVHDVRRLASLVEMDLSKWLRA
jgi:Sulfotransferase family